MSSSNLDVFMPVIIMMGIATIIYVASLTVAKILAPKGKDSEMKTEAYECGEEPIGTAWAAFNVRFYVVGLIFIIFDVESVLMFPIASVFKKMNEMGNGLYVLIDFVAFILILSVGVGYCWKKGDLDWVKSYRRGDNE